MFKKFAYFYFKLFFLYAHISVEKVITLSSFGEPAHRLHMQIGLDTKYFNFIILAICYPLISFTYIIDTTIH